MRRRIVTAALLAATLMALLAGRATAASVDPDGPDGLAVNAFVPEINTITVSATPGALVFVDTTAPLTTTAPQCTQVAPDRVECAPAGIVSLSAYLGDGDDTFVLDDTATTAASIGFATVDAGDGDDIVRMSRLGEIVFGGAGDDLIAGGGGKDTLDGQLDDDTILGGDGDDRVQGNLGNDRVDGGDGVDDVTGNSGDDVVLGGAGNDKLDSFGPDPTDAWFGADSLDGGPGDDQLSAEPQAEKYDADVYNGGDGTDSLTFAGRRTPVVLSLDGVANDGAPGEGDNVRADIERVTGGSESDTLVGSPANDTLDGGAGDDMILGLDGDDTLEGGVNDGGSDSLDGGNGNDTLRGGPGDDSLSGGDGRDGLFGGGGSDTLSGDPGDDGLAGGPGLDALSGGDGDDVLRGGDEVLIGADGADDLDGGSGTDTLLGGPGNDRLDGGGGPDRINGELGRDTVTYETRAVAITVTFDGVANDGEPGEGDNVAADVEAVIGSAVADTLSGDGRANALDGGSGDDVVEGAGGVDQLTGGTASDFIRARDGTRDDVDCGEGVDVAVLDTIDVAKNCEFVDRGARTRKPVVARSTELNPSGTVLARIPDAERFVALKESLVLPLGTDFDARRGAVAVQTARRGGATQTATFSQGQFTVEQSNTSGRNPITEIRLRGGSFKGCKTTGRKLAQNEATIRVVKGKGRGHYRTRGRNSSAIVRGTEWLVEDRCDGTLTRVFSGVVEVRDFVRHKTVLVRAGHRYLARAPGP